MVCDGDGDDHGDWPGDECGDEDAGGNGGEVDGWEVEDAGDPVDGCEAYEHVGEDGEDFDGCGVAVGVFFNGGEAVGEG